MELKPFNVIVRLTKDGVDEALADVRERSVKARAKAEMAKIDASLANLETSVHEICTQKDLNLDYLLNILDDAALLERRRDQYASVLDQLFPLDAEAPI